MSVDPGLQPERTKLAWQRTMLSSIVFSLLLLRIAFTQGSLVLEALLGVQIICSILVAGAVIWKTRARSGIQNIASAGPAFLFWVTVSSTAAFAGASLLSLRNLVS
uniref:DUF202 domain-containing protein n=1 Tax=Cupriavidus taiwanensis TaxID=164546 RepID=UPI000E2EA688|nr:DUF202 domain-containing protein [Cupriavidus taiwanensis]